MPIALMCCLAVMLSLGFGQEAHAYIGPGAGLSMIGAFWALIVAVFAALSFLILWPFRRMLSRKRTKPESGSASHDHAVKS